MNKTKTCKKCGEEKDITLFVKSKSCKDGYRNECKECKKEYNKQYRKEHKEKISEYHKQWHKENREEILKKQKQYRKEHKEEISECNKRYREKHKEEISECNKRYYQEHKEKISEYHKQWHKENREEKSKYNKQYNKENPHIKFNASNRRRSKEEQQGRGINGKQWFEMMKFFDFKCAYSGEYLGGDNKDNKRTIDHIFCLDNGGLNEIWNVVPMYSSYNFSKKNKNPMDWYKEQDFYSEDRLKKIIEWQIYSYEKWATEDDEDLILIVDII